MTINHHPALIRTSRSPPVPDPQHLRQLALARKALWEFEKQHDTKPDYQPCTVPRKGTPILETIAPHRTGTFIKQLPRGRFDTCLVQWDNLNAPTISSLYVIELQREQLRLF